MGYIPDLDISLKEMQKQFPDWDAESIAAGLNRFFDLLDAGVNTVYDFYDRDACTAEEDKADTKLFYMPGKKGMPFAIICPGGAYRAICTLKEGFTTGARLNQMGYSAFILCYRVGGRGLLPKPMDDLAAALKFILQNAERLGVDARDYAVIGYSAGGHLAGEWGTELVGASCYGLPGPSAIFMAYTPSEVILSKDGENPMDRAMRDTLFGDQDFDTARERYCIARHINQNYPPAYLWHCKDDPIVPIRSMYEMIDSLNRYGVPYKYREVSAGGHGFGMGEFYESKGWLEEAVAFWQDR